MAVYFFALASSLVLCYMDRWKPQPPDTGGARVLDEPRKPTVCFFLACGILLFFAVLRADTVGGDLRNYKRTFDALLFGREPAYALLQNIVAYTTGSFHNFYCRTIALFQI